MYNPEWVKVVHDGLQARDDKFAGDSEAWHDFILHDHGVDWVNNMVMEIAVRFYPDVPGAMGRLNAIVGDMLYSAYCHDEIDSHVTYEFTTSDIFTPVIALFANAFKLKDAHWRWFVCETCHKQTNGELTLHVEIENH